MDKPIKLSYSQWKLISRALTELAWAESNQTTYRAINRLRVKLGAGCYKAIRCGITRFGTLMENDNG